MSLTVHKNTLAQRKRHRARKELLLAAKRIGTRSIDGYVIIGFDKDGNNIVGWHTGDVMPPVMLSAYVQGAVSAEVRAIENATNVDFDDDDPAS